MILPELPFSLLVWIRINLKQFYFEVTKISRDVLGRGNWVIKILALEFLVQ